jgi:hypothetical protein
MKEKVVLVVVAALTVLIMNAYIVQYLPETTNSRQ